MTIVKMETESITIIIEVFWGVTLCYWVIDVRRFESRIAFIFRG
jgi:hypothetical protein